MREITVDKEALIQTLIANRIIHLAAYEAALVAYKEQAIAALGQRLEALRGGNTVDLVFRLPVPESHLPDYDRAIGMLELELNDRVLLDDTEYTQFVEDQWSWKRSWETNTMFYAASN